MLFCRRMNDCGIDCERNRFSGSWGYTGVDIVIGELNIPGGAAKLPSFTGGNVAWHGYFSGMQHCSVGLTVYEGDTD